MYLTVNSVSFLGDFKLKIKKNMISVDTVYQRVLATANKEQRGYITPQEFNLYANQAQMEIFEQYMNDKEDYNSEKIYPFTKIVGIDDVYDLNNLVNDNNEKDFYAIGSIFFNGVVGYYSNHIKDIIVEELNYNEWRRIANTPLTRPSHNRPIYYVKSNVIHITQTGSTLPGSYEMTYIAKPKKKNWT